MRLRLKPGALSTPAAAYIFGLATAGLCIAATLLPIFHQALILRAFLIGVLCGAGAMALLIIVGLIVSFEPQFEGDEPPHARTYTARCSVPGCPNEVRRPETGMCEYHNGWIAPEARGPRRPVQ